MSVIHIHLLQFQNLQGSINVVCMSPMILTVFQIAYRHIRLCCTWLMALTSSLLEDQCNQSSCSSGGRYQGIMDLMWKLQCAVCNVIGV